MMQEWPGQRVETGNPPAAQWPGRPAEAQQRPQASGAPARQPVARYQGELPTDPTALFPHLVAQESGGRAGVLGPRTSYGQAQGRTQMLPGTAEEMARTVGVPWRPELMTGTTPEAAAYQDRLGLEYLRQGFRVTGNARDALRYYHGGPDRSLWGPKTDAYAEEVLARYGGGAPGAPVSIGEAPAPAQGPEMTTTARPGGAAIGDLISRPWMTREPVRILPAAPVEYDANGNEVVSISAGVTQNADGSWNIPENLADGSTAVYRVDQAEYEQWQSANAADDERDREYAAMVRDPRYQQYLAGAKDRRENIPAWLENITSGATLGGVNQLLGGADALFANEGERAMAYRAQIDAGRLRQDRLLREDPAGTVGMQLLGGLFTPGLKTSGSWIGSASTGAGRLGRAAVVGAGYGAASGAINADGDLGQRLDDAAAGGALGAGLGIVGQAGVDRLLGPTARAGTSQARALSRQGVDLTPGQMLGGAAGRMEEGLQSVPVLGDAIKSARNRNMGTFDRAAINEALSPINARVQGAGRDAIRAGDEALSAEYSRILDPLVIQPDGQMARDIQRAVNPANLSRNARRSLSDTTADIMARVNGPISGRDFKQIESELTALIRSADNGGPEARALSRPLRDVRGALRDRLRRQDPAAADALEATNTAYANFDRVRRAASNPATAREDGLFSPGNLNSVLARTEGRAYARGEGRLQDLTDAGVSVLGNRVPDSGTPLRSLMTMGAPTAGGLAMMGRGDLAAVSAAVVGLGSLGYGQAAQRLLNAVYRGTDPGEVRAALALLSRIATRDPAALAHYQQLVEQLLPEPQRQQAQPSAGLLGAPLRSEAAQPRLLSPQ